MSVYHFWSPTCAPCNVLKPIIQDLKEEFSSLTWISVNTHDDTDGYATKYNVTIVPTIVVDSSKGIERHTGTVVAPYYRILRNATK
jgi:thiol-disulfide isomerase/thioredoxin